MCIPIKYCEHCKLFVYEKKSKLCMEKEPQIQRGGPCLYLVFVSLFDCFFQKNKNKDPNSAGRPLQRSLIGVFCFFRQILWYLSFWLACQVCVCVFVWMHTCGRERTKHTNARVCAYTCIFILHIKKIWIHVRVCIRTCTYTLDMHHMYGRCPSTQSRDSTCIHVCVRFPNLPKKEAITRPYYTDVYPNTHYQGTRG